MRAAQASEARIIAWFCCSASTFHGGIRPLTMQAQNQSDCSATEGSNRDATKAPTVVLPDPGGPESTRRNSSLTGQTYFPAINSAGRFGDGNIHRVSRTHASRPEQSRALAFADASPLLFHLGRRSLSAAPSTHSRVRSLRP